MIESASLGDIVGLSTNECFPLEWPEWPDWHHSLKATWKSGPDFGDHKLMLISSSHGVVQLRPPVTEEFVTTSLQRLFGGDYGDVSKDCIEFNRDSVQRGKGYAMGCYQLSDDQRDRPQICLVVRFDTIGVFVELKGSFLTAHEVALEVLTQLLTEVKEALYDLEHAIEKAEDPFVRPWMGILNRHPTTTRLLRGEREELRDQIDSVRECKRALDDMVNTLRPQSIGHPFIESEDHSLRLLVGRQTQWGRGLLRTG